MVFLCILVNCITCLRKKYVLKQNVGLSTIRSVTTLMLKYLLHDLYMFTLIMNIFSSNVVFILINNFFLYKCIELWNKIIILPLIVADFLVIYETVYRYGIATVLIWKFSHKCLFSCLYIFNVLLIQDSDVCLAYTSGFFSVNHTIYMICLKWHLAYKIMYTCIAWLAINVLR